MSGQLGLGSCVWMNAAPAAALPASKLHMGAQDDEVKVMGAVMEAVMDAGAEDNNRRLPLLEAAALNPDQHELYQRLAAGMLPWAKQSGFKAEADKDKLLGPFNAMLYSPELGAAQLNYLNTERDATALDARVREVVIGSKGCVSGT